MLASTSSAWGCPGLRSEFAEPGAAADRAGGSGLSGSSVFQPARRLSYSFGGGTETRVGYSTTLYAVDLQALRSAARLRGRAFSSPGGHLVTERGAAEK
jgi:hypothetical protein